MKARLQNQIYRKATLFVLLALLAAMTSAPPPLEHTQAGSRSSSQIKTSDIEPFVLTTSRAGTELKTEAQTGSKKVPRDDLPLGLRNPPRLVFSQQKSLLFTSTHADASSLQSALPYLSRAPPLSV